MGVVCLTCLRRCLSHYYLQGHETTLCRRNQSVRNERGCPKESCGESWSQRSGGWHTRRNFVRVSQCKRKISHRHTATLSLPRSCSNVSSIYDSFLKYRCFLLRYVSYLKKNAAGSGASRAPVDGAAGAGGGGAAAPKPKRPNGVGQ